MRKKNPKKKRTFLFRTRQKSHFFPLCLPCFFYLKLEEQNSMHAHNNFCCMLYLFKLALKIYYFPLHSLNSVVNFLFVFALLSFIRRALNKFVSILAEYTHKLYWQWFCLKLWSTTVSLSINFNLIDSHLSVTQSIYMTIQFNLFVYLSTDDNTRKKKTFFFVTWIQESEYLCVLYTFRTRHHFCFTFHLTHTRDDFRTFMKLLLFFLFFCIVSSSISAH